MGRTTQRTARRPRSRGGRAAALGVALLTIGAFAPAALAQASAGGRAAEIVRTPLRGPGTFKVTVVVGTRTAAVDDVKIHIGGLVRTAALGRLDRHVKLELRIDVSGRTLRVLAIGRVAQPLLSVHMERLEPATKVTVPRPHTPASASAAPAAGSSPVAATSTATTIAPAPVPAPAPAPPAPPAAPLQPPGPSSPYTRLAWSEDFGHDWASEGGSGPAQEAVPATWGFDSWGGCGAGESSYSGSRGDAYLTSQGLAIPVSSTGPTSWRTAQLDTKGIAGESWQYGTIEASIQLPVGHGLCPAFWMLADNGSGELDILEAPAFVNPAFGPYAPYSIFTLHSNLAQIFEAAVTPTNWNPAQPNVFGVIWTPTSITWTVNYIPYATATAGNFSPAVWSSFTSGKFHLLIDEAVGGWPGDPPPNTIYTQPMTVQWVKVYQ